MVEQLARNPSEPGSELTPASSGEALAPEIDCFAFTAVPEAKTPEENVTQESERLSWRMVSQGLHLMFWAGLVAATAFSLDSIFDGWRVVIIKT